MLNFFNDIIKYIKSGHIRASYHLELPLVLVKYSVETVYSNNWDTVTINSRGNVYDNISGEMVANTMPKFFNYSELDKLNIVPPYHLRYKVYDKIDGSLITIFRYKGKIVITSSGSFYSDTQKIAENLYYEKYHNKIEIKDGYTYQFELIHPLDNQRTDDGRLLKVVDYGDRKELILLAVRENISGDDLDIEPYRNLPNWQVTNEIQGKDLSELINIAETSEYCNAEGFIVKYENGFRIKVKYKEYFRLHRIYGSLSKKTILESVINNQPIPLDNVPNEFFDEITNTKNAISDMYDKIESECTDIFNNAMYDVNIIENDTEKRKKFSQLLLPRYKHYSSVLFAMYDEKEYRTKIFKYIERELNI